MRKDRDSVAAGAGALAFDVEGEFRRQYPALFEHLTAVAWEEGGKRETTTLLICVDAGSLKACVNDRASGMSAWVSAESLEGLLRAIEDGLATRSLGWRPNRRGR